MLSPRVSAVGSHGRTFLISAQFAPRPSLLHTLTSRLAEQLSDDGDIAVPELNGKPLLWRATRALAGSRPCCFPVSTSRFEP